MLNLKLQEYLLLLLAVLMIAYGFYRWGSSRGRKEVINVFDQILVQMYRLVTTGKNEELHSFLSDLCGKQLGGDMDQKLGYDNNGKKGYR